MFLQLPQVSCKSVVQNIFRNQEQDFDQKTVDILKKADALDVATAFIRILEGNIAKVLSTALNFFPEFHDGRC